MINGSFQNVHSPRVLPNSLKPILIGEMVSLGMWVQLTHALCDVRYGINPAVRPITTIVISTLTIVIVLACYAPIRRRPQVDPIVALRYE